MGNSRVDTRIIAVVKRVQDGVTIDRGRSCFTVSTTTGRVERLVHLDSMRIRMVVCHDTRQEADERMRMRYKEKVNEYGGRERWKRENTSLR